MVGGPHSSALSDNSADGMRMLNSHSANQNHAPIIQNDDMNLTFKHDLKVLFGGIEKSQGQTFHVHMVKYLYSSIVPEGCLYSGIELGDAIFSGKDNHYSLPRLETEFLMTNANKLSNLIVPGSTHVSLGPGSYNPVTDKDIPVARLIKADRYVAVDINNDQAEGAAQLVHGKLGIASEPVNVDFSKAFFMPAHIMGEPKLITMFGGTIGQYAVGGKRYRGEVSLSGLLDNIGRATDHKGILLATIDSEEGRKAEEAYKGKALSTFMKNLWRTAAEVICDKNFNHQAFDYTPRYDAKLKAIVHSYTTTEVVTAKIDDEQFAIPKGSVIDIGYSQKLPLKQIEQACLKSGWTPVESNFDYHGTALRAIVCVGKNTPRSWMPKP